MKITIIADDNTGATDAAGMLTSYGAGAVLLLDSKKLESPEIRDSFDVVVLGTGIRSVSPEKAWTETEKAVSLIYGKGAELIQLKYCSTFDSTPEGNIGQSIDAARSVIGFPSTPVCPALPVNGRTTYMGYHFVGKELLSESSLRNHPLNPMTDSNLIRWLSYQTKTPVGLIDYHTVKGGEKIIAEKRKALEEKGIIYHVTDALCQDDIDSIVRSYADTGFMTGGSGISESMGRIFFRQKSRPDFRNRLKNMGKKTLVISGSDSVTTRNQKKHAVSGDFVPVLADPYEILNNSIRNDEIYRQGEKAFSSGKNVIISIDSSGRNSSEMVRAEAARKGITPEQTGELLGIFLGKTAAEFISNFDIDKLIVAGGETSGAVCRECGIDSLEVGYQIDPGVPYCFPLGKQKPLIVLKSGNFGSEDLFYKISCLHN